VVISYHLSGGTEEIYENQSGQSVSWSSSKPSTYRLQVWSITTRPKYLMELIVVQFSRLRREAYLVSGEIMAATPSGPSDTQQPIIWGNVIGILVFHLLALYGLVTLPLTEIRWQTYLWGESPACRLIMSIVTGPASLCLFVA
jgi:hypothetical protein